MSVYLYRISQEEIVNQKDTIINTEVDIVLLDNSVFHGIIKEIQPDKMVALNMVRNKYTFLLQDISEIIYSK